MEVLSYKRVAAILKVIATPRRLRILDLLLSTDIPTPTSTIAAVLGLEESQVSYNLTQMRILGIVFRSTSGRWAFYTANKELLALVAEQITVPSGDDYSQPYVEETSDEGS